jgi:hypothetical protein
MNTKEIILPEGWVIDKQIGNKLIVKENKYSLDNWRKCYDKLFFEEKLCFINEVSNIDYDLPEEPSLGWINVFPKEYGKPMLALMQLLVCYKAWIGDWKPDWTADYTKYCIRVNNEEVVMDRFTGMQHILAFPTLNMRNKFLETFKDLLEQAKPLL